MSTRDEAKKDWKCGMKYKEIAEKYSVPVNTVKSWASRYWKNEKVATKKQKKLQPLNKKLQPICAPMDNKNDICNKGGAPKGNANALKHGAYSIPKWDFIDDVEKTFASEISTDEESLLIEQIQLFSIRERRIMIAINKYKNSSEPVTIDYSIRTDHKRAFSNQNEQELYEKLQKEKIENGEILPGKAYSIQTSTTNKDNIVARLESELTSVQSKKTKAIEALIRLRQYTESSNNNEVVNEWVAAVMEMRKNEK